MKQQTCDVVVIGAGAAGMMCAFTAGRRGLRVTLVDHARDLAEKIRISGGGRCNFTNRYASPAQYLSQNPHFCRSALARYTPQDFLTLLDRHGVPWHEKHKGQLFCDRSSHDIIEMLHRECDLAGVTWQMPAQVTELSRQGDRWRVSLEHVQWDCRAVVIATGGLSIPKIGASDFGHRVARQFGLVVTTTRPGLVPLTFDSARWQPFAELAGVSVAVRAQAGEGDFHEDLLFTHRGLSGPAILQISSFWQPGQAIAIDLLPGQSALEHLRERKSRSKQQPVTVLAEWLPRRLAECWARMQQLPDRPLAELPDRSLQMLANSLQQWSLQPSGSAGYAKAEVTVGGVDTRGLSSKTMQARDVPGLHFVGEVVDVTGHLGGYNFQWAWASGYAAGNGVLTDP